MCVTGQPFQHNLFESHSLLRASSINNASPELAFSKSAFGQALLDVLAHGSPSNQTIANFLLRNQVRVTALGIEDLAAGCQVSTATVSRFAREMGFANYAGLRNEVASILQNILQPVEKLRTAIERRSATTSPADGSLEYAMANLEATRRGLESGVVNAVVAQLTRAKTVYVMGFGLSAHLAGMLALHLQPFCRHVVEVAGYGGSEVAAGHLANIDKSDVLVVLSFPRYANDAIRLARFAHDHGSCVVTITDSTASPLAAVGNYLLLAPSTHPTLPSSGTAALAVIEALVSSLMTSNKKNLDKAARLTAALSSYLHDAGGGARTTSVSPAAATRKSGKK